MSLRHKYDDEIGKLEKLCMENELEHAFVPNGFPLKMTISPLRGGRW